MIACLAACNLIPVAYAGNSWVGGASGAEQDWNNATNWGGALPGNATDVTINLAVGNTPTITAATQSFTPRDIFIGSGANGLLTQTAGAAATGGGNWLFVGRNTGGNGTFNISGGMMTAGEVHVGASTGGTVTGAVSVSDSGTITTNGWFSLADSNGATTTNTSTLTVSGNGVVNVGGHLVVASAGNSASAGKVDLIGGTINVGTGSEQAVDINRFDSVKGQLNVNGGTLKLLNNSDMVFSRDGGTGVSAITLGSGAITGGSGSVINMMATNVNGNNTVNLNGGTLTIGQIIATHATGTRAFNFGGGTLKAAGASPSFFSSGVVNTATLAANTTSTIDNAGYAITLGQAIGGSGALTFVNSAAPTTPATTTLAGLNTFTGNVGINSGTLALNTVATGVTATGLGNMTATRTVTIASGGTLSLLSGNQLGTGGNSTVPSTTIAVNSGGLFQSATTGTGYWNNVGPLELNGGTVRVGNGANTSNFQALALLGTVTVGGSSASTIDVLSGATSGTGIHLGQGAGSGQQITFNVGDVVAGTDLTLSAPLINTSGSLVASGLIKSGAGTMLLTSASAYTGATTINAGSLQLGNGGTTGSLAAGSAIVNHGTLAFNRSNVVTQGNDFNSVISGTGAVTQAGAGTLLLTGVNTYSGTTTITAGILQLGDGTSGKDGTISNSPSLVNNGALVFNRFASSGLNYAGAVSGSGTVTKSGAGTQILSGLNTYSGDTNVTAGTLVFAGSASGPSTIGNVAVANNATLGVKVGSTGQSVLSLTNKDLSLGSGGASNLAVDLNLLGNSTAPLISLPTGTLNINGDVNLSLSNFAGLTNGTITLIDYGSIGAGSVSQITPTVTSLGARSTATLIDNAGNTSVDLNIDTESVVWSGAGGGVWKTAASGDDAGPNNWARKTAQTATNFWAGDLVEFNDSYSLGGGPLAPVTSVDIQSSVSPTSVLFNNGLDYTISSTNGSGIASGSIVKSGSGNLTINTANSFAGGTLINAGKITLGNAAALGTGSVTLDGGDLDLNSQTIANAVVLGTGGKLLGSGTLSGVVSGSATLVRSSGVLTLTGTNTYTGGTTINSGTIAIDNAAGLGLNSGVLTLNAGTFQTTASFSTSRNIVLNHAESTILVNPSTVFSVTSGLSGGGNLTKTGGGTLELSGANTFAGSTIINGGLLHAIGTNQANGGVLSSSSGITVNAGGTLSSNENGLFGWNGPGEKNITVNAGGIMTAGAGVNVNVGNVTLNGGTMSNGGAAATWGSWTFRHAGDKLLVTANSTVTALNVFMKNGASIDVSDGKNLNFTGTLTNSNSDGVGALVKNGAGTLTLSGNNSYTGSTTVNAGTVDLAHAGTNSIGTAAVVGGLLKVSSGTTNVTSDVVPNTRIDNGGTVEVSGGTLNINGGGFFPIGNTANTTSVVTVSSGAFQVSNGFGTQVGRVGTGILNVNGGTYRSTDGAGLGIILGEKVTGDAASGTINLNGGTLTANRIRTGSGTAVFNFNGGTFKPSATNNTNFWDSSPNMTASVKSPGAIIDTNGFDITIAQALVDGGGNGGLTKAGAGTLRLTGNSNYTGGTTIDAGTLRADNAVSTLGTGVTNVNSGGTLAGGVGGVTGHTGGDVNVNSGGTITAGTGATATNSVGTLASGAQTWKAGGKLVTKFENSNASAGTGFDTLSMTTLSLANLSSGAFNLVLLKTATGTFNAAVEKSYVLATTTGGTEAIPALMLPSGYALPTPSEGATNITDLFVLQTADINIPNIANYSVTADLLGSGNYSINFNYNPAPEPTTTLLVALAGLPALSRRRRGKTTAA